MPDAGPTSSCARHPTRRLDGDPQEEELAPIWVDLVGQPVTLATLDDIAARIGAAYRARRFVLSQAVLPAQTVEDGVVTIAVVEGFVDRVSLTGGADNQRALARQLFAPVEDERPARLATLERSILLARDTFGGTVETVLEPSPDTFAAADLGVLIVPEQPSWFATVDNRGSRLFGKWTLGAGVRSYNLLGLNERLDGLVAGAPRDRSLAYGALIFDAPVPAFSAACSTAGASRSRATCRGPTPISPKAARRRISRSSSTSGTCARGPRRGAGTGWHLAQTSSMTSFTVRGASSG